MDCENGCLDISKAWNRLLDCGKCFVQQSIKPGSYGMVLANY
jgi:hypothetical protein